MSETDVEGRDERLAYALFRATLGLNILLHGAQRIFLKGASAFADSLVPMFAETPLPASWVRAFGLGLPWVEAVVGGLLMIGLATRASLVAGALLMAVLVGGTGLRGDWTALGVQMVYVIAYYLLLARVHRNGWALDGLFARERP